MTLKSRGANKVRLVNRAARAANKAASRARLVNRAAKPDRSKGTIPRRGSFLSG